MNVGATYFLVLAVLFLAFGLIRRRAKRNRRTGLPAPSPTCRRVFDDQPSHAPQHGRFW